MPQALAAPQMRIPLSVKLLFTLFIAVLVPVYSCTWGPTNFLYFCDISLFLALLAVWTERSLPASMAAVGILLPQLVWMIDLVLNCLGLPGLGFTDYMFDSRDFLAPRLLSLFHAWLPFFLLYLVFRLGYDRRALLAWTTLACVLILIGYFLLPAPPAPPENPGLPVNVNFAHGPSNKAPQTWMPPLAWVVFLMAALPACFFIPTHLLLRAFMPQASSAEPEQEVIPDSLAAFLEDPTLEPLPEPQGGD